MNAVANIYFLSLSKLKAQFSRVLRYTSILCFLIIGSLFCSAEASAQTNVLILYDNVVGANYQKLGFAYAIMLRNLLGHWNANVIMEPVQNYTAGQIGNVQATFYLGQSYANPLPAAFLSDVANATHTVVWFKYNLWELAWPSSYGFEAKYGFTFSSLKTLDGIPSAATPNPGFFDTVTYKNMKMVKYYAYDASTNTVNADPDVGAVSISNSVKAQQIVPITDSTTNTTVPYVTRSGNLWYVADIPFSFIGPRDRYLVICDLLHDMLGDTTPASHKALVRLEDVGALVDPTTMSTLSSYMKSKSIPFAVAAIPHYKDPLGYWNDGVPVDIPLALAFDLQSSLHYAQQNGGKILMHGYTHQYGSMKNKNTGVSGDDFEFWNAVANTPVAEDSVSWAGGRLDAGRLELLLAGIIPFAWEAPHYQSSPNSIAAVPSRFKTTYQRVVYYTGNPPKLNSTAANKDYAVGQFFPYVIQSDYYGQRVIPENLGNVEYNICNVDPFSCTAYTAQDILTNAQYALVVRDGFASFFFHPFWLEPDLGTPGLTDFKSIIQGISNMGYQWADPTTLP